MGNAKKKTGIEKRKAKPPAANIEVRHYVHQVLSDELDEKVKMLLAILAHAQWEDKEQSELNVEQVKRYCVGLREARRSVVKGKALCLVVAPNLEVSTAE